MKIPMTTGTAGAMSLFPMLLAARTTATAGATSAIAPIVAIQPLNTDIQEVAGRTRTLLNIALLQRKIEGVAVQNAGHPVAGRPVKRAPLSRRLPSRTSPQDRSFPRADPVCRNGHTSLSAERSGDAIRTAR